MADPQAAPKAGAAEPHTGDVTSNLNDPHETSTMPHTGADAVGTDAGHTGSSSYHAEPAVAGILDATVFVSLAMAVFIAILLWKKVPGVITGGLDRQIAGIRSRLEEAAALRAEAEALRDEYARKIAGAEAEMAGMMSSAEAESQAILAKASADAEALVARRTRMAEDKIAAAERAAVDQVRARAAQAATLAAEQLIRERLDARTDRQLVDQAISGLGRPN